MQGWCGSSGIGRVGINLSRTLRATFNCGATKRQSDSTIGIHPTAADPRPPGSLAQESNHGVQGNPFGMGFVGGRIVDGVAERHAE